MRRKYYPDRPCMGSANFRGTARSPDLDPVRGQVLSSGRRGRAAVRLRARSPPPTPRTDPPSRGTSTRQLHQVVSWPPFATPGTGAEGVPEPVGMQTSDLGLVARASSVCRSPLTVSAPFWPIHSAVAAVRLRVDRPHSQVPPQRLPRLGAERHVPDPAALAHQPHQVHLPVYVRVFLIQAHPDQLGGAAPVSSSTTDDRVVPHGPRSPGRRRSFEQRLDVAVQQHRHRLVRHAGRLEPLHRRVLPARSSSTSHAYSCNRLRYSLAALPGARVVQLGRR
jgi:hypothetical protein